MAAKDTAAKTRSERNKRYYDNKKDQAAPSKSVLNKTVTITPETLTKARAQTAQQPAAKNPFEPYKPAPGVVPEDSGLAMDEAFGAVQTWANAGFGLAGFLTEGLAFVGYPYLSELAQRPEYRRISEVIATEMTRRWIKIQASGEEDKADKIKQLGDAMDRLKVRDVFREAAEQDGLFGRSHIYCDFGKVNDEELKTSVGTGFDRASKVKIEKGSLQGLRTVEALWCYPTPVNNTNPLGADFYKPQSWYVQGKQVHGSRLLTIIGREVPDILKPAYAYGGLSMSQMAKPHVDNWLRTRQSVADLIASFSVSGIRIEDIANAINLNSGEQFFARVALFNQTRANSGTMVLGKDEEFFNVSTPLGTLDALQAQTQEHMSSVSGVPLVKLLGITPSGLNASSDGEVRVFYDMIHSYQEKIFTAPLDRIFAFVQISEFGEVDPDLTYSFEPLWSLDEKEEAEVKKVKAETAVLYESIGVVEAKEIRTNLAKDPDTDYPGLDLTKEIEPPDPSEIADIPGLHSDPADDREAA